MYRGRVQLGQYIPLTLLCKNAAGTPTLPDSPPVMKIWSPASALLFNARMPILDRFGTTGLFQKRLFLDTDFGVGLHTVTYTYDIGAFDGVDEDTFEIVEGGNADGAVQSVQWLHKPHAEYVVKMLDSGNLTVDRNPKL